MCIIIKLLFLNFKIEKMNALNLINFFVILSFVIIVLQCNSNITYTNKSEIKYNFDHNSTDDELKILNEVEISYQDLNNTKKTMKIHSDFDSLDQKIIDNKEQQNKLQEKEFSHEDLNNIQKTNKVNTENNSKDENEPINDNNEISIESPSGEEYNTTEAWEKLYNQEIDPEEEDNQVLVREAEKVDVHPDGKDPQTEDEDVVKDWEKKLSDFEPAEMLTFAIEEDQKEVK
jgi:hypothetical protein